MIIEAIDQVNLEVPSSMLPDARVRTYQNGKGHRKAQDVRFNFRLHIHDAVCVNVDEGTKVDGRCSVEVKHRC